jgi:membrane dipeptidase
MKLIYTFTLLLFALNFSFPQEDSLMHKAVELSKNILILDTHIDLPYQLNKGIYDVSGYAEKGHFDYRRSIDGGLDGAFMSIFIPTSYENKGAKNFADKIIKIVEELQRTHPDKFNIAYSTDDILKNFKKRISLPLGMENGSPIEGDLKNLKYFYDKGIRYITLAHVDNNHISDSSGEPEKKWNGLSPFGKEVIKEMNRLGMMVDVSHISDEAFYDVMKISEVPVIASHSGCRFFTPGFERNMSDEMIKALAANGGVIQIIFASTLINENARNAYDERVKNRAKYFNDFKHLPDSEIREKLRSDFPIEKGTISDIVKHINHVVNLVGIDHVGFGSDFDGVENLPEGMEDVSKYPNLIYELLKHGYSEEEIEKICSGNILRVWKAAEDFAQNK